MARNGHGIRTWPGVWADAESELGDLDDDQCCGDEQVGAQSDQASPAQRAQLRPRQLGQRRG
ncbi:MAG TPA: hypothetical protein VN327_06595, partial [Pseudonocardiaceae bacterium]|nr:hypothetical protein [Pseudonocardiaceae bacterium]